MTISTDSHDPSSAPDLVTDPYGYFEHMRRTAPVWRGTLMESDMMPAELKNPEEWTLFDFESVFAAFRDDDVLRLRDVQQHDRPGLRPDDPRHAR